MTAVELHSKRRDNFITFDAAVSNPFCPKFTFIRKLFVKRNHLSSKLVQV